eukprot:7015250-Ditylum_brightwellii.AAC.1
MSMGNLTCIHNSESESAEDNNSFASMQQDKMDVLKAIDIMAFNDEDSNNFNVLVDVEEHLEYMSCIYT